MRNAMPCVGLIVLAGCLTFIVAPDEEPPFENGLGAWFSPKLPMVVIDAGHGGNDHGARANGLREKDLSLDVAIRVQKVLRTFNFPTALTRFDDRYVSLSERTAVANQHANALFVSIHFNDSPSSASSGIETIYATEKLAPQPSWSWMGFFNQPAVLPVDNGEALAGAIQTALVLHTDAVNRGIKQRPLFVVRHTYCPAVLVEGGFMNNPLEAQLISNEEYRDRLAKAIAEGVMSYQKNRRDPAGTRPQLANAGN